jgi:hypothetical protein
VLVASEEVTVGVPQLSVAVAVPVLAGMAKLVHDTVMSAGQDVMTGACVSLAVAALEQVPVIIPFSLMVNVTV